MSAQKPVVGASTTPVRIKHVSVAAHPAACRVEQPAAWSRVPDMWPVCKVVKSLKSGSCSAASGVPQTVTEAEKKLQIIVPLYRSTFCFTRQSHPQAPGVGGLHKTKVGVTYSTAVAVACLCACHDLSDIHIYTRADGKGGETWPLQGCYDATA